MPRERNWKGRTRGRGMASTALASWSPWLALSRTLSATARPYASFGVVPITWWPRLINLARYAPCCAATCAVCGSAPDSPPAQSPIANTLASPGRPSTRSQPSVMMRPDLFHGCFLAMKRSEQGLGAFPAAHTHKPYGTVTVSGAAPWGPLFCWHVISCVPTSFTRVCRSTRVPYDRSVSSAWLRMLSEKTGRIDGPAWMRVVDTNSTRSG
mmetsp:Transcript_52093/g.122224  ORF Transcript_52093/g.122224 Transcript_52093/m.122224 type:complete len:211 (+) Transcript_52093:449-1081(+)